MVMSALVSAKLTGAETFISGFPIKFEVQYDPAAGDEAKNTALIWLESVLKPDTKVEILSIQNVHEFDIDKYWREQEAQNKKKTKSNV